MWPQMNHPYYSFFFRNDDPESGLKGTLEFLWNSVLAAWLGWQRIWLVVSFTGCQLKKYVKWTGGHISPMTNSKDKTSQIHRQAAEAEFPKKVKYCKYTVNGIRL